MTKIKRILAVIMTASILLSTLAFTSGAVQSYDDWYETWESIKASEGQIMLTPGADRTQMNFSWQSKFSSSKGSITIGKSADLSDGKEIEVSRFLNIVGFEWTQEATATELEANTTYYYQYTSNGNPSDIYSFRTGSTDSTKFLFVSDPQIGRARLDTQEQIYIHDTYGWTNTLETAFESHNNIDFILCSGDEVEHGYSEEQYSMFESPAVLRSYPFASTIGNHDFYSPTYSAHFNNPNRDTKVGLRWPAGNGYYFSYNDILFVVLDSNNFNYASNDKILDAATKAYPHAKWRVVMMHHSPYDANSQKYFLSKITRSTIAPYFDKYGIDLCISGHDHYYSRSYIIKNNKVTNDVEVNNVYTNPKGTLYVSANTASGCNYSNVDESNINQYTDFCLQTRTPHYSIVDVANGKLTVSTYETSENKMIDTVSIVK